MFEGSIKIIPIGKNAAFQEAFDIKVNELMIISIRFLEGCAKPTLALLYQEGEYRHVQTYVVNAKDKELSPGPWKESAVEQASNLLIAVPPGPPSAPLFGGIIVGESAIAYKSGTKSTRIPINACTVICACHVDANRILLGQSACYLPFHPLFCPHFILSSRYRNADFWVGVVC